MKKILISLLFLIILTACVSTRYSYYPVSSYGIKKVSISARLANAEDENATAMPKARRDLNVFILNSLCRVEIEYASIISNIMLNEKTA